MKDKEMCDKLREILMSLRCSQNKHITGDVDLAIKDLNTYYIGKVPKNPYANYTGIEREYHIYQNCIDDFHKNFKGVDDD